MLISVIVPAYNSQESILRTLVSADQIACDDLEIICVNDGSTDGTQEIINRFSVGAQHSVTYRNTPNRGVSAARNLGMSIATGDWVYFLDADDAIDFERFGAVAERLRTDLSDADCVKTSFRMRENEAAYDRRFVETERLVGGADIRGLRKAVSGCPDSTFSFNEYLGCVWGGFFKRELILANKLEMDPGLHFMEDMQFQLKYFAGCKQVIVLPDITYEYVVNDASATHSWSSKQEKSLLNSLGLLLSAVEDDEELSGLLKPRFAYYILLTVLDRRRTCYSEDSAEIIGFLKSDSSRSLVASFGSLFDRVGVLAPKHLLLSQSLKVLVKCLGVGSDASV